ncbi:hypothetical protein C0J52_19253 [Blattella germanica]|nr:hypothetical protein C0J52_19253 [Blattella germanica]
MINLIQILLKIGNYNFYFIIDVFDIDTYKSFKFLHLLSSCLSTYQAVNISPFIEYFIPIQ